MKSFDEILNSESANLSSKRVEYSRRRAQIFFGLQSLFPSCATLSEVFVELYNSGKSCNEIEEFVFAKTSVRFSARSVERSLKSSGVTLRKIKEAFGLAIKNGRVVWALRVHKAKAPHNQTQLSSKTRLEVLSRDQFSCVLCGSTAKTTVLEVDHIVPRVKGGSNELTNLRTLCHECNVGKRYLNQERPVDSAGFVSGRV